MSRPPGTPPVYQSFFLGTPPMEGTKARNFCPAAEFGTPPLGTPPENRWSSAEYPPVGTPPWNPLVGVLGTPPGL